MTQTPDYNLKEWLGWPSMRWQAFWVAVIGGAAYVVASLVLSPTLAMSKTLALTLFHEGFHAVVLIAGNGTVSDFAINADGSGQVIGRSTSELHQTFVSAAGLLGTALIGALTLYTALTRRGIHAVLVLWGIVPLWICYWYATDTVVCLTLYGIGVTALVLAYIPLHGTWKAPFLMFAAIMMAIGVLDGIDYAYVAYVGDPRALNPSDSQRIADILASSVDQVANVLVAIIFAIYGVAAALIGNFLQSNR